MGYFIAYLLTRAAAAAAAAGKVRLIERSASCSAVRGHQCSGQWAADAGGGRGDAGPGWDQ